MAKQSGLGDNCYVGGFDLSGDIGSLSRIGGGPALKEMTGINKSAIERLGLLRDGEISFQSWFNPTTGASHDRLSNLPTTDTQVLYMRGTAVGSPGAALLAKQVNYDGNREADGSLSFAVQAVGNGYGLEWGHQLTAGLRTDTTATNGTSIDTGASAAFGAQAYLQVTAFTGTSVTVTIQDSADNSSFAAVTGLAFTAVSAAPAFERVTTAVGATVRRYVRAVTTGTFNPATFAVVFNKNDNVQALF